MSLADRELAEKLEIELAGRAKDVSSANSAELSAQAADLLASLPPWSSFLSTILPR
jgi:hypothetical protein